MIDLKTQFLLGVPRSKLQKGLVSGGYFSAFAGNFDKAAEAHLQTLADSGVLVRMYLPFGNEGRAAPYCRRRF